MQSILASPVKILFELFDLGTTFRRNNPEITEEVMEGKERSSVMAVIEKDWYFLMLSEEVKGESKFRVEPTQAQYLKQINQSDQSNQSDQPISRHPNLSPWAASYYLNPEFWFSLYWWAWDNVFRMYITSCQMRLFVLCSNRSQGIRAPDEGPQTWMFPLSLAKSRLKIEDN